MFCFFVFFFLLFPPISFPFSTFLTSFSHRRTNPGSLLFVNRSDSSTSFILLFSYFYFLCLPSYSHFFPFNHFPLKIVYLLFTSARLLFVPRDTLLFVLHSYLFIFFLFLSLVLQLFSCCHITVICHLKV